MGAFILKDLRTTPQLEVNDVAAQFETLASQLAGNLTVDNFSPGGLRLDDFEGSYRPRYQTLLLPNVTTSATTFQTSNTFVLSAAAGLHPRIYKTAFLGMVTDFSGLSSGSFPITVEANLVLTGKVFLGAQTFGTSIGNATTEVLIASNAQTQICLQFPVASLSPIASLSTITATLNMSLVPSGALEAAVKYSNIIVTTLYTTNG